jgi:hypothetical protein
MKGNLMKRQPVRISYKFKTRDPERLNERKEKGSDLPMTLECSAALWARVKGRPLQYVQCPYQLFKSAVSNDMEKLIRLIRKLEIVSV